MFKRRQILIQGPSDRSPIKLLFYHTTEVTKKLENILDVLMKIDYVLRINIAYIYIKKKKERPNL